VLKSLNLEEGWEKKYVEAWNKMDLLTKVKLNRKLKEKPADTEVVPISALKGTNLHQLKEKVEEVLKATNSHPTLDASDTNVQDSVPIKQEK
jgi:50S ribosomal subunit-associated GTPase HflX